MDIQFLKADDWKNERPNWSPIKEILIKQRPDGGKTENHWHKGHEYYIVWSGQADVILDGQRFKMRDGEVVAIFKGTRHHIENASDDFAYVALREETINEESTDRIYDSYQRQFVSMQGRYIDGPVTYDEIKGGKSCVLQSRTWFWLKQKPEWSFMTSMGHMFFKDGTDEPDYHRHELSEVYICTKGHLTALVDDKVYEMHQGDIVTIPTGAFHRVTMAHGDSDLVYFYGEPEGLRRYGHLEAGRDSWVL